MSAQADSQSTLTIMGDSTSGGPTTPEGAEAASTYCVFYSVAPVLI